MKKIIAATVMGLGTLALFGSEAKDAMTTDPNIVMTALSTRQRYPWNGKVDIDFTFTCAIPEAYAFVNFKAEYKDKNGATVEVPMKTFEQFTTAFCTNAGSYRVTWDSSVDAPNLTVTNLKYTVTANMAKYMVIDLSKGTAGPWPIFYYEDVPDFPGVEKGKWDDYHKTTNLVLRLVQPGTFKQAWSDDSDGVTRKMAYRHSATLTQPYYLAVFEMTQEQFYLMRGNYGSSGFTGGRRKMRPTLNNYQDTRGQGYNGTINWPVTGSAVTPDRTLGIIRAKTGSEGFDLPTDCEWEYAARCGGAASGFWNDGSDSGINTGMKFATITNNGEAVEALARLGRYKHNGGMIKTLDGDAYTYTEPAKSCDETQGMAVVGSYEPNAWGFYDMHGNAWEWVNGVWGIQPDGYWTAWRGNVALTNDVGLVNNPFGQYSPRIARGGAYNTSAKECAIAWRAWKYERDFAGIRLCWRFPTPAQE